MCGHLSADLRREHTGDKRYVHPRGEEEGETSSRGGDVMVV